jgi:hypothetical protein
LAHRARAGATLEEEETMNDIEIRAAALLAAAQSVSGSRYITSPADVLARAAVYEKYIRDAKVA